ncbi:MAG: class I SAM-dependent methyltransferase [Bacteroidetes bacterium]|nr:class I SAM-dependent methyltransferase [Bacteroidota bacterium]
MKDWHTSFFKIWEKVQFRIYTEEQNKAQTDFIQKALKLKKGMSVLDVPCGFGRISHILAQKGINVTGIEFNKRVLNYGIEKAKDEGLKINYIAGDMRNFSFRKKFDAALCWFGSIGYFSDEDNEKFIKSVSRCIKKGGKFLIDTHTLETIMAIFQPVSENRYGKIPIKEERELDLETSRINVKWTLGKESKRSSIRLYSYKEMTDLLKRYGFGKFKGTVNYKGDKFKHGSTRLFLVCEKIK